MIIDCFVFTEEIKCYVCYAQNTDTKFICRIIFQRQDE